LGPTLPSDELARDLDRIGEVSVLVTIESDLCSHLIQPGWPPGHPYLVPAFRVPAISAPTILATGPAHATPATNRYSRCATTEDQRSNKVLL